MTEDVSLGSGGGGGWVRPPCFKLFSFNFFSSQVTAELRWTARGINKEVEHKSGRLKMERRRAQGTSCVGRDLLNSV